MAAHDVHKKHTAVRKFNRDVYNRLSKKVAGRYLYTLVEHIGRKSGQEYSTPVVAQLHQGCFYIPLPYDKDTDWCLNIQAAGKGILQYEGNTYPVTNPQVIGASEALPVFPAFLRNAFKLFKIEQFLRLDAA